MINNKNAWYKHKNNLVTVFQQHDSKRPSWLVVEDNGTQLVSVMIPSNVNYRVISLVYMTTVTCHFLPAPLSHQVVRSDIQPRAWYINRSRQTKIKNRIERNATSFCPQILFWVSSPMCPPVT